MNVKKVYDLKVALENITDPVNLELTAKELQEIPDELFKHEAIYGLGLGYNKFVSIPSNISKLTELISLSFSNNPVEKVS